MVKPEYIESWRRRFEQQRLEGEARAERARQALPQVVANGIYLYQLQVGSFSQVRKMSLLR